MANPRSPGAFGLSHAGQLFTKETQAIFYNWWALLPLLPLRGRPRSFPPEFRKRLPPRP